MADYLNKDGLSRFKTKILAKMDDLIKSTVTSINGLRGDVTIAIPPTPKSYVIETWSDSSSWYRKWSDGYIEQAGIGYGSTMLTFPVPFSDTNYSLVAIPAIMNEGAGSNDIQYRREDKYTNRIYIQLRFNGGGQAGYQFMWYACGF